MCNQQTDKNLVEKTEPASGIDNAQAWISITQLLRP